MLDNIVLKNDTPLQVSLIDFDRDPTSIDTCTWDMRKQGQQPYNAKWMKQQHIMELVLTVTYHYRVRYEDGILHESLGERGGNGLISEC